MRNLIKLGELKLLYKLHQYELAHWVGLLLGLFV